MFSRARRVWDEWNIRCAVLTSLFLQVFLIVFSSSRKRRGSLVLRAIIWLFYLLADWIAAFAVGLISSAQTNDCPEKFAVNEKLAAFWAPFLLLHLGGPDSITAFSLEDNELWIRHLLGLVIELASVVYVLLQSWPNEFWIPTVLMLFAGTCKYAERTFALYQACLGNFKRSLLPKPDPGPNYAQFMEEYSALETAGVPVTIEIVNEPQKDSTPPGPTRDPVRSTPHGPMPGPHGPMPDSLVSTPLGPTRDPLRSTPHGPMTDSVASTPLGPPPDLLDSRPLSPMGIVGKGYNFFEIFKGVVVDHMFSFHERNDSRKFFLRSTPAEAFKVMEVELNFLYDALYTKNVVVHRKIGYLFRFLCTALLVACFQQFASHPLHDITHFDKIVTYILLVGAMCLDLVGMFNLVFSDWAVVSPQKMVSAVSVSAQKMVSAVTIRLPFAKRECDRWSNTMPQHSFITFCLTDERFRWLNVIADFLRIKDILDEFQYKEEITCEEELKEFIFNELQAKAKKAQSREITKEIYSARGNYVLSDYRNLDTFPSILSSLSDEVEYDESLLLWHIATELCYFTSSGDDPGRRHCKHLSDYMLYLLVMKPTLMSAVAGIAQIRFQDTCEEAKKIFRRWQSEVSIPSNPQENVANKNICEKLLDVKTVVKPSKVKGDRSQSLLFDACILAKDLKKLSDDERWEIMRKVWVELLSYAASHCRPDAHARQLSQGGELITFVWLQMLQFGLAEQFRIEAGHARAKLLTKEVEK